MNRLSLRERIAIWLVRNGDSEASALTNEIQIKVATEIALEASLRLATIQRALLDSIMDELANNDIFIGIDSSVFQAMNREIDTLNATKVVVGEIAGFLPTQEPKEAQ
jgi:hypothetical protein